MPSTIPDTRFKPKIVFPPDSTRLVALFPGGDVQIWNFNSIPTYPAERIRPVSQSSACRANGWGIGFASSVVQKCLGCNTRKTWVSGVGSRMRGTCSYR